MTRRLLVLASFLLLAVPLGASGAEADRGGLSAALGAVRLGAVDPGSSLGFEIPLNNTGDESLHIEAVVSPRQVHADGVEAWMQLAQRSLDIPAGGSTLVHGTLSVPAGAHSGEYVVYVSFAEAAGAAHGASATAGVDVPVIFLVPGVEVWGVINVPGVVEPEHDVPGVAVTMINYRPRGIHAEAVVQLIRDEIVWREWRTAGVDLPHKASHAFHVPFTTRGLSNGSYELRVFGNYTSEEGTALTPVHAQTLWVGSYLLDVDGFLLSTGRNSIQLPPGSPYALPTSTSIQAAVALRSHAPDAFRATLMARFGARSEEVSVSPLVFPGASTVDLGRLLTPAAAGPGRLEFFQIQDGVFLPLGHLNVTFVEPRIVVSNVSLDRIHLRADLTSPAVTVDAVLVLEVVNPADHVVWSTTESINLPQGLTVPIERDVQPGLPDGDFTLRWRLASAGRLDVQSGSSLRIEPSDDLLLDYLPYAIGTVLFGAAAGVVVWARRPRGRPTRPQGAALQLPTAKAPPVPLAVEAPPPAHLRPEWADAFALLDAAMHHEESPPPR